METLKIDISRAKPKGGTVIIDNYRLKNDTVFCDDAPYEYGSPQTPDKIFKKGTFVSIHILKTLSGNYAELKIRENHILYVHRFEKDGDIVNMLIEKFYPSF